MKLSQVRRTLIKSFNTNKQPYMLWGPPGVGKSETGRAVAEAVGGEFIDARLSIMDPSEMRFMMRIDKGAMKFDRPFFIPAKGKGIVMLDELVQCTPSMQAAASQLILDRRVGEHVLGDGWMVVGAGNKKSHKAATNAMPTHIRNRFVHLNVDVDVNEWIAWALSNNVDMRIIAYIKWRPMKLHEFDPQSNSEAFASPRSMFFASGLLDAEIEGGDLLEVMKGCVGETTGTELTGFLAVFDKMPSIDGILLNPMQSELPGDLAVLHAVTTALTFRADKDNIGRIVKYFDRLKDAQRPEFSGFALKEIALKKPELTKTRAYCEWASAMAPLMA